MFQGLHTVTSTIDSVLPEGNLTRYPWTLFRLLRLEGLAFDNVGVRC